MNNNYTKIKISLNCEKDLRDKIEFIGKIKHRDLSGEINHIVEKYVNKYIKKHELESEDSMIRVEGKTLNEYLEDKEV